jgi:hypothetical protein
MGSESALRYGVKFASDEEMPEGHNALVIQTADEAIVVYRESVVDRGAVTTAWASLHALATDGRPVPVDELMPSRLRREGLSDGSGSRPEREISSSRCGNLRIR